MTVAIANGLALPNPLSNGTVNDAIPVMADFNYLLAALNRALIDSGGGAGVNAQSVQIHNLANGTSPNDAINLSQLGGYAALAGAAFTGAVSLASTLGVTGAATLAALTASGLITGNAGFAGTTLSLSGTATSTGGGFIANGFFNVDTTQPFGFSHNRAGQAGYHLYNGGGVTEWAIYQPAHATDDALHIAQLMAGALTDRIVIAAGGAVTIGGALNLAGALTPGSAANCVGYLGAPSRTVVASTSVGLADLGGTINLNGTSLVLTIPANAGLAVPVDSFVLVRNLNASPASIVITTDTLTLSGTTTVGTRTLAQNGEARLAKVGTTLWFIGGTGIS